MITVLLVLQAFITLALIGVVLIQRSEGGGLGLGSSQGMGSFMTGRGTANLLTRTTAILATAFMVLSLVLALLYRHGGGGAAESILNGPAPAATTAPATNQAPPKPAPALPPIPGESSGNSGASPTIPGAAPAANSTPATPQH
ncbi:preprotein translocase subunit SecG [Acidiphilium sp. AL]|uniref:Protein-export membrane protein SecG n=1 Tax=Acidiphilium iwatense TaxID=768198 RepID=A0ABS9DSY9_9PROT|nr:preprotein translocase subunit SecG [Acidiphilium iwatense]MCU4159345.1 preprotein translocase subunit SecG [Acidiphilium sp. AL]